MEVEEASGAILI